MLKVIKRVLRLSGDLSKRIYASFVFSFIDSIVAMFPVGAVFYTLTKIQNNKAFTGNDWLVLFGILIISLVVRMVFKYLVYSFQSTAGFEFVSRERITLGDKLRNVGMGFFHERNMGDITTTVTTDLNFLENYSMHLLDRVTTGMVNMVVTSIFILMFDWRLGLLSLIPVVAAFLIMGSMTGQRMKDKMTEYQNALEEMSSEAVEYVRGIPVVKTFGQSVFSFKRFRDSIKKYEKWTIAYTKELRLPMTFYTTIINAAFAVLIAVTFYVVRGGESDTFLLNLMFYIIITPIITVTLNKIMYASENQMIVEDALTRIDSILEKKPLTEAAGKADPKDMSITFENVSFRYEDAAKDALHNINLKIREGEHVAFVGPSGGGKSTLASLIARFFDATEGKIRIGGVDVRDIPSKQLMDMVSFVFQDSKLLKMSVYENVRMGRKDATREEVMEALKNAQCEDIIEKLPDSIDTVIGAKGTYVSGGEAQRLSIARAMLKNAPILILDEATAFADPDNEAKVQQAFSKLSTGKTVIMIAHRLSSVVDADRICVLKDGEIVESGTHKELSEAQKLYAHMGDAYNKSVRWKVGE